MAVEDEHSTVGGEAHAADAHASGGGFPPFDQIDTFASQIFWLALTFGVLYLVFARVILPKVAATLAARDKAVADDLAAASAANEAAEAAGRSFDARLFAARTEAREAFARTKADIDAFVSAESARVEAETARRLEAAEVRIGRARSDALSGVAAVAEAAAADIAERLAGVRVSAAAARSAVETVLRERG